MNELILAPDNLPVLSKQSAADFHRQVVNRIYDTGNGMFEYVELIKFFAALDKQINGDGVQKIEPDTAFVDKIREEINWRGEAGKYISPRGVKFEVAETGTAYDFSECNDFILQELEAAAKKSADAVKERKEFLKRLPSSGVQLLNEQTGELCNIFPPSKSSKSSFKVTIPKK